jgi:serine phosphatase RsbU (regulator of sigma subunit)
MLRDRDANLGALLARMNAEVSRDNPAALFVTAFVGVLDLDSGELEYCNAGQENPWLLSASGSVTRLCDGDGPPLCALDDFDYRCGRRQLVKDDVLCIVSDGFTEAADPTGALYGPERVEKALTPARSANAAVEALARDVADFVGAALAADDQTMLAVQWRGAR